MLVPSLQRYQAYPLSKPGIDLCTPDFLSRSVRYQSISHRTDRTVTFGSQLNFATVSVINLSSARKTKLSAYMQEF